MRLGLLGPALAGLALLLASCATTRGTELSREARPANAEILAVTRAMPEGGGYSVGDDAFLALECGLERLRGGEGPGRESCPSFCSAGTWLVLLEVLRQRGVDLGALEAGGIDPLLEDGTRRRDGDGLWGRWNSNGPGAAVLLAETDLGLSFEAVEQARPGDFVKFWWTEEIGGRERGHLAVFLGWGGTESSRTVRFWSATEVGEGGGFEGGYAVRAVGWSEVKHVLFTRLLLPADPREIGHRLRRVDGEDRWLHGLLREDARWEEVLRRSGVDPDAHDR